MIRASLLILGIFAGGEASAATVTFAETPGAEQIGIVTYHNELEAGSEDNEQTFLLQTSRGSLALRLRITPNINCADYDLCPDTLEVVEAPPGTAVVPGEITVPELEAGEMRLMEWTGL